MSALDFPRWFQAVFSALLYPFEYTTSNCLGRRHIYVYNACKVVQEKTIYTYMRLPMKINQTNHLNTYSVRQSVGYATKDQGQPV